jgi:hypothetical protein
MGRADASVHEFDDGENRADERGIEGENPFQRVVFRLGDFKIEFRADFGDFNRQP